MNFIYIPPDTFTMGSPLGESGRYSKEIQHRVTLTQGYYLQTTEVTQGQWVAVMDTRPWSAETHARADTDGAVSDVSWNDCQDFIRKLNKKEGGNKYRLPTEAEWEHACRAGSTTRFCFVDGDYELGDYAWYEKNAYDVGERYAHAVGAKKPNEWGLYDMHGNVWEWCQDWYGYYPSSSVTDQTGPSLGSFRVVRGGSWSRYAGRCRSAYRGHDLPGGRGDGQGFRLARTP